MYFYILISIPSSIGIDIKQYLNKDSIRLDWFPISISVSQWCGDASI